MNDFGFRKRWQVDGSCRSQERSFLDVPYPRCKEGCTNNNPGVEDGCGQKTVVVLVADLLVT